MNIGQSKVHDSRSSSRPVPTSSIVFQALGNPEPGVCSGVASDVHLPTEFGRAAGSDEFMLPLSIENPNPDVASRNVRPRPSVNSTMRNMSPPPGLSGFESPRERNIVDRLDLHPSPTPSKRSRSNSASSRRARGMDRETAHRGNPSTRDSRRGHSGDPVGIR